MYRENYINSLRTELLEMVADVLTPVALNHGYSEVPLETNIKWRPQVLVIGNYSSGKSMLINDFIGADIQATGQAPTDDSFTIITYDDKDNNDLIQVTEERDGKVLLNDPEYPFESLKKHGQRFAAHFCLKKVNAPFLKNLAIIDTPGMLDSITERDRGYNYQEVIGDLAQIADLILVLFDPHKAGTVREAHASLRDTLPSRTFEDRILFVLNRIDECNSMVDLLRVYGTLCWNLSQITGRKDIPMIHLTYSPKAAEKADQGEQNSQFLRYLENQRDELKQAVLQAPRHRLDHLATFVETHSERLAHLLEGMISYRKKARNFRLKTGLTGFLFGILSGLAFFPAMLLIPLTSNMDQMLQCFLSGAVALLGLIFWASVIQKRLFNRFHNKWMENLVNLTPLETQTRRDSWASIQDLLRTNLDKSRGKFSLRSIKQEYSAIRKIHEKGSQEIREALNELSTLKADNSFQES